MIQQRAGLRFAFAFGSSVQIYLFLQNHNPEVGMSRHVLEKDTVIKQGHGPLLPPWHRLRNAGPLGRPRRWIGVLSPRPRRRRG